jgi:hypothetical protein
MLAFTILSFCMDPQQILQDHHEGLLWSTPFVTVYYPIVWRSQQT